MTDNKNKPAMIGNERCCLLASPPFQGLFFYQVKKSCLLAQNTSLIYKSSSTNGVLQISVIKKENNIETRENSL